MREVVQSHSPDIYVHVPKTAGTSLRAAVIEQYGPDAVWVYSTHFAKFTRADRQVFRPEDPRHVAVRGLIARVPTPIVRTVLRTRERRSVPAEVAYQTASALIGHFSVDSLQHVPGINEARWHTVVREPLVRMVSHYRYLQQYRNFHPTLRDWLKGHDPDLPFAAFAMGDNVQNFQTQYTGTDTARFTSIGTAEQIGTFMVGTGLIASEADAPRLNRTEGPQVIDPVLSDAGFLRDFASFHSLDYEFYAAAKGNLQPALSETVSR